jgi:uncharacterized radical SAM superfamily Fe-S cluster-containing enzyme
MLVVTIAKGVNDREIKAIMEYARENNDIIAGVVFQPVSLCGRITLEDLMKLRYTASDLIEELRKATDGVMDKFYPLSSSSKLTQLLTWFNNLPGWSISAHDDCGFASFLPIQNGEWTRLEDLADVEGLMKWANQCWDMVEKRQIPKPSRYLESFRSTAKNFGFERLLDVVNQFSDSMSDLAYRNSMKVYFLAGGAKYLKNFELKKLIEDPIYKYGARFLNDVGIEKSKEWLQHGFLFVGCMHFQDAYDLDVARVQKCVVHYGVLDPDDPEYKKVLQIPFCTFNTIHREPIEKKWALLHSKPLEKTPEQHAQEIESFQDSLVIEKKTT